MQRIGKIVLLFHIVNLCLTIILNNIYDWQGKYFMVGLVTYLLPNILGLALNFISGGVVEKFIRLVNAKKIILPIVFFIINEFSYSMIEKQIIFFGLFRTPPLPNIIPIDSTFYVFISLSAAISAIIVFLKYSTKRK